MILNIKRRMIMSDIKFKTRDYNLQKLEGIPDTQVVNGSFNYKGRNAKPIVLSSSYASKNAAALVSIENEVLDIFAFQSNYVMVIVAVDEVEEVVKEKKGKK